MSPYSFAFSSTVPSGLSRRDLSRRRERDAKRDCREPGVERPLAGVSSDARGLGVTRRVPLVPDEHGDEHLLDDILGSVRREVQPPSGARRLGTRAPFDLGNGGAQPSQAGERKIQVHVAARRVERRYVADPRREVSDETRGGQLERRPGLACAGKDGLEQRLEIGAALERRANLWLRRAEHRFGERTRHGILADPVCAASQAASRRGETAAGSCCTSPSAVFARTRLLGRLVSAVPKGVCQCEVRLRPVGRVALELLEEVDRALEGRECLPGSLASEQDHPETGERHPLAGGVRPRPRNRARALS